MSLTVFLVEDSAVIVENLVSTLQELADAEVVEVADREEDAKAWLSAHTDWQIAVVDLFIKAGSGLGVLRALLNRRSHQRVVVLSNYATPQMRSQCRALGADAVFDKSTELDEFLDYCIRGSA